MSDPSVQTRAPDASASSGEESSRGWFITKVVASTIVVFAIIGVAAFSTTNREQTPLEATLLSVFLAATSIFIGGLISSHYSKITNYRHQNELNQKVQEGERRATEHRDAIALQASAQLFTLMDCISTIRMFAAQATLEEFGAKDLRTTIRQIEPLATNGFSQGENAIRSWRAISPDVIDQELAKLQSARGASPIEPLNQNLKEN